MTYLAIFLTIGLLLPALKALGNAAPAKPPEHGGGKDAAKAAPKEAPPLEAEPRIEGPDAKNALGTSAPTRYVHQWIPMPKLAATDLKSQDSVSIGSRKGRSMVVFFIASWCEPCQNISGLLLNLTGRYSRLPVDFYFVFSHDTLDDARGFMTEHKIPQGYLAEFATLKSFNNPELPSIYVGDRQGWLLTRKLKAEPKDIKELQETLDYLTAF